MNAPLDEQPAMSTLIPMNVHTRIKYFVVMKRPSSEEMVMRYEKDDAR
jgi:hypothetical protein